MFWCWNVNCGNLSPISGFLILKYTEMSLIIYYLKVII